MIYIGTASKHPAKPRHRSSNPHERDGLSAAVHLLTLLDFLLKISERFRIEEINQRDTQSITNDLDCHNARITACSVKNVLHSGWWQTSAPGKTVNAHVLL